MLVLQLLQVLRMMPLCGFHMLVGVINVGCVAVDGPDTSCFFSSDVIHGILICLPNCCRPVGCQKLVPEDVVRIWYLQRVLKLNLAML